MLLPGNQINSLLRLIFIIKYAMEMDISLGQDTRIYHVLDTISWYILTRYRQRGLAGHIASGRDMALFSLFF